MRKVRFLIVISVINESSCNEMYPTLLFNFNVIFEIFSLVQFFLGKLVHCWSSASKQKLHNNKHKHYINHKHQHYINNNV